MDDDVYQMAVTHSNENPFKKYLNYLEELDELTDEQKRFSQGIGKDFINLLENTNMSKVYKMPVLMAFYNHGNVKWRCQRRNFWQAGKTSSLQEQTGRIWRKRLHMRNIADFG